MKSRKMLRSRITVSSFPVNFNLIRMAEQQAAVLLGETTTCPRAMELPRSNFSDLYLKENIAQTSVKSVSCL